MNVFGTKKSVQTIYGNSVLRGDIPVTIRSGAPATTDVLNVPTMWIDSDTPDNIYFLTNINTISGAAEWVFMNDVTQVSPLTTKGDMFVYGSSNTRLPVGTNTQALISDSSQTTGLRWATIIPLTSKGDLFTNTGTADARLPVGTNTQALIADSSQTTGLKWATIIPLTSKGDIFTNTGTVDARLPVGTNTQALISDSSQTTGLRWATIIPLTSKGDLFIHDGSNNTRLPAGINNQVLLSDNTATEGARWATVSFSPTVIDLTEIESVVEDKTRVTSIGTGITRVGNLEHHLTGSYGIALTSKIQSSATMFGPSACVFASKADLTATPHTVMYPNIKGTTSNETLTWAWPTQDLMTIQKSGTAYDGDIDVKISTTIETTNTVIITLTGTSTYTATFSTLLATHTCVICQVMPYQGVSANSDGPVATWLLAKNVATAVANNTRITSSPGVSGGTVTVAWPVSSDYLNVSKNNAAHDGAYTVRIYNNFLSKTVTLTSTTNTTIFNMTKNFTGFISVVNSVNNGPSAIFVISKNAAGTIGFTSRLLSVRGITTLETLSLRWLANSGIELSKSGSGYDGTYIVYVF